jgi:hypothetical protein
MEDEWVDSETQVDRTLCVPCALVVREQIMETIDPERGI